MADRWIIGTGFTRGIGLEVIKKLHEQDYKVIHLGRKKTGFESEFIWWDLLNPISDNPIGEIQKILFGKNIHGFIYCAGLLPMLDFSESDKIQKRLFWQSQSEAMRVNYLACAELIEEILPFLFSPYDNAKSMETPFVAHLSSLAALDPLPGLELYGATKAAALHYFAWLAKRFAAEKLTCLSLHPGTVATDMVADIIQNPNKNLPIVQVFQKLKSQNKILSAKQSAQEIFNFLFCEKALKISSHGKLFLVDQHQIFHAAENNA